MPRIFLYICFVSVVTLCAPQSALAITEAERTAIHSEIARLTALVSSLQEQLAALKYADQQELMAAADIYPSRFYDGPFEAVYSVQNATLKPLTGYQMRRGDKLVFTTLQQLVGEDFIEQYISEFRVFNDTDSYMGAYIEQMEDGTWLLALNRFDEDLLKEHNSSFMVEMLIHESAHIPFFEQPGYVEQFIEEFWIFGKIVRHYNQVEAADLERRNELGIAYFKSHEDDFVSEYAATSPTEDAVESFVQFVKLEDVPTGRTLKDRKVRFFNDYPALVEWREQLRSSGLI